MQKRFWKASRLLEIFIIVLVLSVLGILTIPYYDRFQCRSKQSEARMELVNLLSAEKLYRANTSNYATLETLSDYGIIKMEPKYYSFRVIKGKDEDLIIKATSQEGSFKTQDDWSIDESGKLQNLQNACNYP